MNNNTPVNNAPTAQAEMNRLRALQIQQQQALAAQQQAARRAGEDSMPPPSAGEPTADAPIAKDTFVKEGKLGTKDQREQAYEAFDTDGTEGLSDQEFEAAYSALMQSAETQTAQAAGEKPRPTLPMQRGQKDPSYPQQGIKADPATDPVRKLQTDLSKLTNAEGKPYFDYEGGPTGGYFDTTAAAVKDFQKDHNLPPTGVVDDATYDAIQMARQEQKDVKQAKNLIDATRITPPSGTADTAEKQHDQNAAALEKAQQALEKIPASDPERAAYEQKVAQLESDFKEFWPEGSAAEPTPEPTPEPETPQEPSDAMDERDMHNFEQALNADPRDYAHIQKAIEGANEADQEMLKEKLSAAVLTEMQGHEVVDRNHIESSKGGLAARDLVDSGLPLEYISPEALAAAATHLVNVHDGGRDDSTVGIAERLQHLTDAMLAQPGGAEALSEFAMGLSGTPANRFIDFFGADNGITGMKNRLAELSPQALMHLQSVSDGDNGKNEKLQAAHESSMAMAAKEAAAAEQEEVASLENAEGAEKASEETVGGSNVQTAVDTINRITGGVPDFENLSWNGTTYGSLEEMGMAISTASQELIQAASQLDKENPEHQALAAQAQMWLIETVGTPAG